MYIGIKDLDIVVVAGLLFPNFPVYRRYDGNYLPPRVPDRNRPQIDQPQVKCSDILDSPPSFTVIDRYYN